MFKYSRIIGKVVLVIIALALLSAFVLQVRHGGEVFDFDIVSEIEFTVVENVMYSYILLLALVLQVLTSAFLVVCMVELFRYIKVRKASVDG